MPPATPQHVDVPMLHGPAAAVTVHFDPNATDDLVVWHGRVVQLTQGGVVLLRDPGTLEVERVLLTPGEIDAIDTTETELLLAAADGSVSALSEPSADPRPLGRCVPHPRWVGAVEGEPWCVAVLDRPRSARQNLVAARVGARRPYRHGLPRRGSTARGPEAFAVSGDTLWMGWDRGEFGGALGSWKLATNRLDIRDEPDNVAGFVPGTGDLFAFGGLMHLSSTHAWIGEAASGRRLYDERNSRAENRPTEMFLVAWATPDRFAFVAWEEVWTVDRDLARWELVTTLDPALSDVPHWRLRYQSEAVAGALSPTGEGLVATRMNGIVAVSTDGAQRWAREDGGPSTVFRAEELHVVDDRPMLVSRPGRGLVWTGSAWTATEEPPMGPKDPVEVTDACRRTWTLDRELWMREGDTELQVYLPLADGRDWTCFAALSDGVVATDRKVVVEVRVPCSGGPARP